VSGTGTGFAPRRVVVALDASPASLVALEAAVEIASWAGAELLGLFVEDIELLRAARMPEVRQVLLASGTGDAFECEALEAQLRELARRAQAALLAAADRGRVTASFRVARGAVARELIAACEASDLLVLGCSSRPASGRQRLGRTARAAVESAPGPLLVLREVARRGPLCAVFGRGRPEGSALSVASRLAAARGVPLLAIAAAATREAALELAGEAADAIAASGHQGRVLPIAPAEAAHVAAVLTAHAPGLLVLEAPGPIASGPSLERLLERLRCGVLLLRRGEPS
jgi:nucleotide-binding universal stress UspA family protein